MVTIPRGEYERLLSIAQDVLDAEEGEAVRQALRDGRDEAIPAEFANRIIDGESAVRVYRELRGLSRAELARVAGVNRVHLHGIEALKKSGSVATMRRLADALGVTIDDLI
ncbi:MAG: helix-turn-helix transcriptional regulator [Rhodobacteraceae bacterium]|nr:helix-turn-helix transcriptional regulator [Paracoccaceae bacterium]